MTANGRSTMRPQGRSPPFLLIGLVVALCILGFNYWSVSKRNGDLASQLANCQVELKTISEKKISAEKRNSEVSQKNRDYENELSGLKSVVGQKDNEINSIKEQLKIKQDEVNSVKTEMEGVKKDLQKCEADKNGIQQELQKIKEELSKNQVNQSGTTKCDQNACSDHIRNVLSILTNSLGKQTIIAPLQQNGIDVAKFADLPDQQGQPAQGAQQPQGQEQQAKSGEEAKAQPAAGEKNGGA